MIRNSTLTLLVISGAGGILSAHEPLSTAPSSDLETQVQHIFTGRSVQDRSFLTGPLKDLLWSERLYPGYSSTEAGLVDMPNFELGLLGKQRLGRHAQHEQALSGLGPLEDKYEVGLFTQGRYGDYLLGSRLSKDATGGHQGVFGEFMAGYEKKLSEKLDLSFGVGTTWADDVYISSFYSGNMAQSSSYGLPLYPQNGASKNASLTVSACYRLSDYWSLGAQVGYIRFLEQTAENSFQHDQESENIVTGFQLQYRLRTLTGGKFRNLLRPSCHNY